MRYPYSFGALPFFRPRCENGRGSEASGRVKIICHSAKIQGGAGRAARRPPRALPATANENKAQKVAGFLLQIFLQGPALPAVRATYTSARRDLFGGWENVVAVCCSRGTTEGRLQAMCCDHIKISNCSARPLERTARPPPFAAGLCNPW